MENNTIKQLAPQDILKQFLSWINQQDYQPAQLKTHQENIDDFYIWFNINFPEQNNFTQQIFVDYRKEISKTQTSIEQKNSKIITISLFGTFLYQQGYTKSQTTIGIKKFEEPEIITPKPETSIFSEYQKILENERLSPSTIKGYINDIEQFFAWFHQFKKGIESKHISQRTINKYRQYLQQQLNFAPASIDRKLSSIKKFFTWATTEDYLSTNPFDKKTTIKTISKAIKPTRISQPENDRYINKKQYIFSTIIIIIFLLITILRPWQLFQSQQPEQFSTEVAETNQKVIETGPIFPWIIKFSGHLNDIHGDSITESKEVDFSLYASQNDTNPLWSSKTRNIQPDSNGTFSVSLGDPIYEDNIIDPAIYFQNQSLYLGINVDGLEIKPRPIISTSANSQNAWKLNNYESSTSPGPLQIPVITETGEISFTSPTTKLNSTNGSIGIEGEAVTITVPYSSTENITLAPLGGGGVDVITNNFTDGALNVSNAQMITGSLINGELNTDLNTANLLDLKSGVISSSKFTVDASGNTTIAGKLIGQTDLVISDSRTQFPISDISNFTLPYNDQSLLGAITHNTQAASEAATWINNTTYLTPRENSQHIKIYGDSTNTYSSNPLELYNNTITSISDLLTINATDEFILNTDDITLSSSPVNVDLIDSNVNALNLESGLLIADSQNTAIKIDGTTTLGDGGTTNYIEFDQTGDLSFYGLANQITGPGIAGAGEFSILNNGDITFDTTNSTLTINTDELISNSDSSTINGASIISLNSPIIDINTGSINFQNSSTISISDASASSMLITESNNPYININTTDGSENITLGNTTTNPNLILNGSGDMLLDTGNIGINETLPSQSIDTTGEIELNEYLYFANASSEYLRWDDTNSNFILSDDLLPDTTDTNTIGNSTTRWNTIYTGTGGLDLGADGDSSMVNYNTTTDSLTFQNETDSLTGYQFYDADGGVPIINIDTSNERVGISNNSPSQALDVVGEIELNEYLYFANASSEYLRWDDTNSEYIITDDLLPSEDDTYNLGSSSYRWQDLFLGPDSLHISCTTSDGCSSSSDYSLGVNTTTDNFNLNFNSTEIFTATANGNIGIGNINPSQKLDVSGNVFVNDSIYQGNSTKYSTSQYNTSTQKYSLDIAKDPQIDQEQTDTGALLVDPGAWQSFTPSISGYITSISLYTYGTSTTLSIYEGEGMGGNQIHSQTITKLVNGWNNFELTTPVPVTAEQYYTFALSSNFGQYGGLNTSYSRGQYSYGPQYDLAFRIYVSEETNVYTATADGNMGIKMDNPSVSLDINGDIEYTGTITDVSDVRLKENFVDLTNSLDKILSIDSYKFNMIGQDPSNVEIGYKAQEVQKYIPELVNIVDPENGYLGVNYIGMIPVITDAIQQQQSQISNLVSQMSEDIQLTSTGDIHIQSDSYNGLIKNAAPNQLESLSYQISNLDNQIIDHFEVFKNIITGGIKAAFINTQNLIADTAVIRQARITDKFISPIIETNSLIINGKNIEEQISNFDFQIEEITSELATQSKTFTQIIAEEADLETITTKKIDAGDVYSKRSHFSDLFVLGTDASSSSQLTIHGNASISGQLAAKSARFETLETNILKAETVEGLEDKIRNILTSSQYATAAADPDTSTSSFVATNQNNETTNSSTLISNNNFDQLITTYNIPTEATDSAQWTSSNNFTYDQNLTIPFLDAESGLFNTFLGVLGTASIVNAEITNSLSVNQSLTISNNSISVLDNQSNTLYLQQHGLGKVDILAGAVVINNNGDLYVDGDLYLAGNIYIENDLYSKSINTTELTSQTATISSQLFAQTITPKNDNVTFDLTNNKISTNSAILNSQLSILNSGSKVASIDASGSATFNKLIIANAQKEATPSPTLTPQTFLLKTNATAGSTTLPANAENIIIKNINISQNSLIYITPTSNTQNRVLYIKNKIPTEKEKFGSITISINSPIDQDITFNWWIIN